MRMRSTIAACLLLAAAQAACAARMHEKRSFVKPIHDEEEEHDLIKTVPGYVQAELKSRHHAGYIPVSKNKKLFYWFAESERDPSSDPVVLWLNGGPGCSSFDGFVYEHGPFRFSLEVDEHQGTGEVFLEDNPYAWNKVANMLFLDSPAGVGLSYSEGGREDYVTNDHITAADAEEFLRRWFDAHPSFQQNEFYISGESYAGVYVPNLAHSVVKGNDAGHQPHINLKGYLVGNGVTDQEVDGNAFPAFALGKSLISQQQVRSLDEACGGPNSYWNATSGSPCEAQLFRLINLVSALNVYDVLEDCYNGPNQAPSRRVYKKGTAQHSSSSRRSARALHQASTPVVGQVPSALAPSNTMIKALAVNGQPRWPVVGTTPRVNGTVHNWAHLGVVPPCTDSRAAFVWLNSPVVREAIHAEPVDRIGEWTICSDRILYTRVVDTLIPIHKELTQVRGLRALIYSGDHDMAVPNTGSETWTSGPQLGAKHVRAWHPWMVGKQVAGYTVEYKGLSYATIKVPENKPQQSLAMFERFLKGESL